MMRDKLQFLAIFVLLALLTLGATAQDTASETAQVTTTNVSTHPSQGELQSLKTRLLCSCQLKEVSQFV